MPSDLRKIPWLAVALLVVLRVSIGWHLLYEGLWKLNTQSTAAPWTAEGYLKNSTGPMRTAFRNMTGDPNDLSWLDYESMSAKWDGWRDRFVAHYGVEATALDRLLDGSPNGFSVVVPELPAGFDLSEAIKSAGIAKDAIKYDAATKKLTIDGKLHLLPTEQAKLLEVIKDAQKAATDKAGFDPVIKAVNDVARQSSKLSYRERLAAMLKGDPERVGIVQKAKGDDGQELVVMVGEVEYYKEQIKQYEEKYAEAKTKFEWDHLERQWSDLQKTRRNLVGPVQALEKDLFDDASKILGEQQLALGPVPPAPSPMQRINSQTMWGLTIFGLLLMVGLFTRLSAIGGAGLLMMFYMAMPPWPGVQEIPSIEHNLIVNKVLVEMIALLAIAALPSGKWFGIDAIISALIHRVRRPK
ncbi:DoxX family protein [Schlesneria paludicola]|uniref:DoxX family protein n=1 Tax=Schlesneria paludicola TaxID=360056 RepID=UPI00029ACB3E|nr:DoxX family protein [Schlesneria paludicola]